MNKYFIKEVVFNDDWYNLAKDSFDDVLPFDVFKDNLIQANARNFGFFLNDKIIGTFTLSQNFYNVFSKSYLNYIQIEQLLYQRMKLSQNII